MESLLHRYRNISVLFVAIIAQIAAIAWQVRQDNDVSLLRIWAVSAVTPAATAIENLRSGTFGVVSDFFSSHGAVAENRTLRAERDRMRLENQLLKNELAAAQKTEALAGFEAHSPSKMIGATVIGTTTGMGTRSVLIDRGSFSKIRKGMAVVTPDGIVGRVLEVYPSASQVLSVTDAGFAAGVESQKNHVHGVMKGLGNSSARIDYVPSGQKVEKGEVFFTSGEDRVFPRGMPAGKVISVEDGPTFQQIYVEPFGGEAVPEQVFVIMDPVHQDIPAAPAVDVPVFLAPDTPPDPSGAPVPTTKGTQADQLEDQYRKVIAAQGRTVGQDNGIPNFNIKVPGVNAPGVAPAGAFGASGPSGAARLGGVIGGSGVRGASGRVFARAASGSVGAIGGSGIVRIAPRPLGASGAIRPVVNVAARPASGGGTRP